jgi:Na+/H+-dicarboxylate symporter
MAEPKRRPYSLEILHPRSLKYLSHYLQDLVRGRLWLKVLVGMALGLLTGTAIGPTVGWVEPRVAAIIRGLAATENLDQLRKVGFRVVVYFVATTVVAIMIGLVLTLLLKPGLLIDSRIVQATLGTRPVASDEAIVVPGLAELPRTFLTLLPTNPLGSMVESDMLRVVIFAAVVGVALVMMAPTQSRPLLDLLGSLQEVCMTVVRWAMLLAPVAVFGLLAQLAAKIGLDALVGMAAYVGTVLLGLSLLFLVYLLVLYAAARQRPLGFIRSVREVLLLAFSTSSSAAVMPLSIRTAEEKLGVRPSVSQFVIPLGATINMNGTALYQGVAAIFLAQVFGVDVGVAGLLLIIITAVGASIGTPATPGVGIVILAMVVETVGVPAAGIALIIGVDRILDMSRTAINVSGDLVATVLMDRWVGGPRTVQAEITAEQELEARREMTSADVVIERPSA